MRFFLGNGWFGDPNKSPGNERSQVQARRLGRSHRALPERGDPPMHRRSGGHPPASKEPHRTRKGPPDARG